MLNHGGVGRNFINMANQLITLGIDVDFFINSGKGDYYEQLDSKINVIVANKRTITSVKRFAAYISYESPDVVISARDAQNLYAYIAIKLSNNKIVKQIATIRTTPSVDYSNEPTAYKFILKNILRFIYPKIKKLYAVSNYSREDALVYYDLKPDNISTMYNPIVTEELINKANEHIKEELPRDFILSVGRLSKAKNYDILIEAMQYVDSCLYIIGEGELREDLEKKIKSLGLNNKVKLLGYKSNPYKYLKACSVFVSSSVWEGLPTVIVEALALGKTVVATDCPGGTSEVLGNGEYGYLYQGDFNDSRHFATLIKHSIDNKLSEGKLIDYSASFSVENITLKYLEAIKNE